MFLSLRSRRRSLRATTLLCCLLTLGASGDDFCLVRLIVCFTPATSAPLPLDDPNTDFVEATDSPGVGDCPESAGVGRVASVLAPLSVAAASVKHLPHFVDTLAVHEGGWGACPSIRLRC
jgi:hypothetical protein